MIPAAFEYHRPADISAALAILDEHGDEARPLAGGQSLIPAMNFRLAQPAAKTAPATNVAAALSLIRREVADIVLSLYSWLSGHEHGQTHDRPSSSLRSWGPS